MVQPINALLRQLEPDALELFFSRAKPTELAKGSILHEPGAHVGSIIFPETAVLTVGCETVAGEFVNVEFLGPEGAFGAFEACGSRQSFSRVSVQVAGAAWRVGATAYRELFEAS